MKIDCVSDLHGEYPEMEGGDLLIVAGDLTGSDLPVQYLTGFLPWIAKLDYRKKIVVCGNHDVLVHSREMPMKNVADFVYLEDEGVEFKGLKIWGSPWTQWFYGVNPKCAAFMLKGETQLMEKWALIPKDTDILITHSPPFGMMDRSTDGSYRYGSKSLGDKVMRMKNLKLHVFGHIHECYGQCRQWCRTETWDGPVVEEGGHLSVNAAHMNRDYEPVNPPIRVVL